MPLGNQISTTTGAVAWVCALLVLVLAGAAGARDVERTAPASAWCKAADMALERGDCARALAILNEQVAGHHYGAVARLGDIHETGSCAHLDLPPARELYEDLIAGGIEIAKARLGQLHLEGLGVTKDVARARRLFQEAVLWMVACEFDEMRRDQIDVLMSFHGVPEDLEAVLNRIDGSSAAQHRRSTELPCGSKTTPIWPIRNVPHCTGCVRPRSKNTRCDDPTTEANRANR